MPCAVTYRGMPWRAVCGVPWHAVCGVPWRAVCDVPWRAVCGVPWHAVCDVPWRAVCGVPWRAVCGVPCHVPCRGMPWHFQDFDTRQVYKNIAASNAHYGGLEPLGPGLARNVPEIFIDIYGYL